MTRYIDRMLMLFLTATILLLFCACQQNESGNDTQSLEPETPVSEQKPSTETEIKTEEDEHPDEEKETDYSVDGWLAAHAEEGKEAALISLIKARSDLVKEKDLGAWYTLQTDAITVAGNGFSLEITDADTIRQIGEFLAPEKLRACVIDRDILSAVEDTRSELFREIQYYDSFSGGSFILLDFHNGVFAGVLFDYDGTDTEREVTELRIGQTGRLNEYDVEIPGTVNPEIPFLYRAGSYNTGREIEQLLSGLISKQS